MPCIKPVQILGQTPKCISEFIYEMVFWPIYYFVKHKSWPWSDKVNHNHSGAIEALVEILELSS